MKLKITLHQPGVAAERAPPARDGRRHHRRRATSRDARHGRPTSRGTARRRADAARIVDGRADQALDPDQPIVDSGLRSGRGSSSRRPRTEPAPCVRGRPDRGRGTGQGALDPAPERERDHRSAADCDVRLSDPTVSKRHAQPQHRRRVEILDTNSANGVVVGNVRVGRAALGAGDVAVLGGTHLTVVGQPGRLDDVHRRPLHPVPAGPGATTGGHGRDAHARPRSRTSSASPTSR